MRVAGDWELKGPGDTRKGFLTPSRWGKSEDESLSGGLMVLFEARGLGAPSFEVGSRSQTGKTASSSHVTPVGRRVASTSRLSACEGDAAVSTHRPLVLLTSGRGTNGVRARLCALSSERQHHQR